MKNQKVRLASYLLVGATLTMGTIACNKADLGPNGPTMSDPESATFGPEASKLIQDQYIVVLKDEGFDAKTNNLPYSEIKAVVKTRLESIALENKMPSAIGLTYGKALKGGVMNMTAEQAELLKSNPMVARVEQDRTVSLSIAAKGKPGGGGSGPQVTPWGITRVGGAASGVGKTAWVIDSGVDLDHPDLTVDAGRSATFLGGNSTPDDQNGHGTHVAGTIGALDNGEGVVGVAAGATIVAVRVLDRRGSGSTSGVIAGVDYVAANAGNGDVANMSLGGGISTTLDNAVISAAQSGVKFALAAGNESDNAANHSPARANHANIYTVSAMNSSDNWASFSNYGSGVDYCAPGVSINSCWKSGGYNTINGTSMAAPHVAGILLLGNVATDGYVNGDPDGNADPIAHR